mmetsp:Transcript_8711/g.24188  ORF Transcript_8711/g.24188 Transcript_8711/m.24188 type:complete len:200 (-) Transcript_8711:1164-1763(-)
MMVRRHHSTMASSLGRPAASMPRTAACRPSWNRSSSWWPEDCSSCATRSRSEASEPLSAETFASEALAPETPSSLNSEVGQPSTVRFVYKASMHAICTAVIGTSVENRFRVVIRFTRRARFRSSPPRIRSTLLVTSGAAGHTLPGGMPCARELSQALATPSQTACKPFANCVPKSSVSGWGLTTPSRIMRKTFSGKIDA